MSLRQDDVKAGMYVAVRFERCDPRADDEYAWHHRNTVAGEPWLVEAVCPPFAVVRNVEKDFVQTVDMCNVDLWLLRPEYVAAACPKASKRLQERIEKQVRSRQARGDGDNFDHPEYGRTILWRGRLL